MAIGSFLSTSALRASPTLTVSKIAAAVAVPPMPPGFTYSPITSARIQNQVTAAMSQPPPPATPAISVLGKVRAPAVRPSALAASPTQAYGYQPPGGLRGPEAGINRRKAQTAQPAIEPLPMPTAYEPAGEPSQPLDQSPVYNAELVDPSPSGDGYFGGAGPIGFPTDEFGRGGAVRASLPYVAATMPAATSNVAAVAIGLVVLGVAVYAYKKGVFK